ncbi:antibiotic biosynthesis monooxygenase [Altericroceibacterium spongiae]|uniref:Antibiotic biosynthesis monooxygenase n=1 Tax=Altericroceibacterium spongiae TaxID=2320269 RepID=A0A420EMS3_9SPHN|nr:putative quinol monooxygenase [Altericroceibacterium spongiae]RKF21953.1 antibiotic biosynthesis monooxygenase [Altericroceibacterium spongiae]
MSYTVFATIPVKPEHLDDAREAVAAIVSQTKAETGCEHFEPCRAADGSPNIYIFERWADRAAFDYHHAQDYTRDVFTKYENWLRDDPKLVEVTELKD